MNRTNSVSLRRRPVAALIAALVAALGFSTLTPIPVLAHATPVAPAVDNSVAGLIVVPGRDRITATWTAVDAATGYQVLVATAKGVVRTVNTTGTTAVVAGLKKSTTYSVRVVATPIDLAGPSAWVLTKTTSATTGRGQITSVAPDGVNTVKVSWKRFPRATSIDIRLSWDNTPLVKDQKRKYVQFSGFPATATSASLTIPDAYLNLIGSTTGNPVYVRLISRNGPKSRTSPVAFGWPSALSASGTQLKVATFNITCIPARPASGRTSWPNMRTAVANSITLADPDVLLVQEALVPYAAWDGAGISQLGDLSALVAGSGLTLADQTDLAITDPFGSRGSHIYIRSDKIDPLDAGLVASSQLIGPTNAEDRYFAWAKLRVRETGETFFAASMHLLTKDGSTRRANQRMAVTRAMLAYLDKLNPEGYPIVVGGDLNVGFNGPGVTDDPPAAIRASGYLDAASANDRTNAIYTTSNSGFPTRTKHYAYVGTRIDYLFVKNTYGAGPVSYANQLVLRSDGTIDPTYYGSDHNLQWAVISLGRPRA